MIQSNPTPSKTANVPSESAPQGRNKLFGRRHVDSTKLLQGARELEIVHNGETYCLRVTRNEKLILTK